MFEFRTGNILDSEADALVNTVNCEGYMGKGIAYQFKIRYPKNNIEYVKVCKNKELKIGNLFTCLEENKIIINFPTKDEWRKKSEYEFIRIGLNRLSEELKKYDIKSVALPPLGCGNGGLEWGRVKELILEILTPIASDKKIIVYEPSKYYEARVKAPPKLNISHLILMEIKDNLAKFNKIRLQKVAFFINLFLKEDYFKFQKHKYGPYCHSIDILSTTIKEFQSYYNLNTIEAKNLAYKNLISEGIIEKQKKFNTPIQKATSLINKIHSDKQLEIIATLCWIMKSDPEIDELKLFKEFEQWPKENMSRFTNEDLVNALQFLKEEKIITKSLLGIELNTVYFYV